MDTEEDEASPVGEQPITEEDMVAEHSAPPEESSVNLSKLDVGILGNYGLLRGLMTFW